MKYQMNSHTEARLKTLLPEVENIICQLLNFCYENKVNAQISCAYRSPEEQDLLYSIGRTKPGKIVTNAKGGQSNHQKKIAVDLFIITDNGLASFDLRWYKKIWDIGVKYGLDKKGLEWSGNWTTFKESAHFEVKGGN